ncbi:MAG: AarF/UbiB family protein [Candidatus Promineifilaceae bacterium]|nr:AarF/ABC1/UbiB kinase family protein [Chloroflexota bacterium]
MLMRETTTPPPPIDRQRYSKITRFFGGVILHLILWDIVLRRVASHWVIHSRPRRWRQISHRFRLLAVEMGGVLIKLGQFLSSRVDVLPPEITDELQGLQDEVTSAPPEAIQVVLLQELGDLSRRFAEIEPEPLAAASLGQTYRARLFAPDGTLGDRVVIKVQRPAIDQIVRTDLEALRVVAKWAMRYGPIRRRADVPALLDEFARTLWEELDYEAEADNAERFQRMFAHNPGVSIPHIYREHTTGKVLVLENVENIKLTDLPALEAVGIDSKAVAERLLDVYFYQIFKEGFFHADPHPGNLFVKPLPRPDPEETLLPTPFQLVFIDFGMVGHVETLMGENLRKVLISVSQKDARGLMEACQDLGFFLPTADLERITQAMARLLDQLWGRNLLDLAQPNPREIAEFGQEFRDLLFDFPIQIPQDFIYLGRAMGILSGMSSLLDPTINPWHQIEKFAQEFISQRQAQQLGWELARQWLQLFISLPAQVERVLTATERGRLQVQFAPNKELDQRLERLEKKVGWLNLSVIASAGLLSATLLYLSRQKKA